MMVCPDCRAQSNKDDLYCRQCGAELVSSSTSIVPVRSNLPAILQPSRLQKGVAAGVGAVAFGVGLELARRSLLSRFLGRPRMGKAVEHALPTLTGLKDILMPGQDQKSLRMPKGKGYEVQETVVYMRRIIRR